jgi:hypothetical protein
MHVPLCHVSCAAVQEEPACVYMCVCMSAYDMCVCVCLCVWLWYLCVCFVHFLMSTVCMSVYLCICVYIHTCKYGNHEYRASAVGLRFFAAHMHICTHKRTHTCTYTSNDTYTGLWILPLQCSCLALLCSALHINVCIRALTHSDTYLYFWILPLQCSCLALLRIRSAQQTYRSFMWSASCVYVWLVYNRHIRLCIYITEICAYAYIRLT